MTSQFKDKVIVVTGGTRGIGFATCSELADKGAVVYACARHDSFQSEISDRVIFHCLDVTDAASCEKLVQDVMAASGHIDGLVADAGITRDALTSKMTGEMFDEVIDVNLKGIFNIVKPVAAVMDQQGGGSIVTVSSIVGEQGNIGQANYAASKAGIIAMTRTWAKEFARKGKQIRVNSVAPGYTLTDMLKSVPPKLLDKFSGQTMLKRLGKPEEIAAAICFLLSDDASYITGTVLDVNGGMCL